MSAPLAARSAGADPARQLGDPETLGLLFESLVIRDVRVYAQTLGGSVFHYRENTGLEADAIIQLPDGRWAAAEVELGQHLIERHGAPAFLAVLLPRTQ